MDVWRITVATLRRWYIFVPLLALTGWGVLAVGSQVQPEYQVSSQFMLAVGTVPSEIPDPYGGPTQAAAVIAIVLNSPTTKAQMEASGLEPDYVVTATDRSTLMTVDVTSDSPESGIETASKLIDMARSDLETRQDQAGISTAAQLGLEVLSPPSVIAQIYDGKVQKQAIVGVLGAALALLITLVFDDAVRLIRRRIARRRGAASGLGVTEPARVEGSEEGRSGSDADTEHLEPEPQLEAEAARRRP